MLGVLRYVSPRRLTHVPVALTPYHAPQHLINTAAALSAPFQLLMHRVADDWAFLEDTLGTAARHDDFLQRLFGFRLRENSQPWRLLISRNDFFVVPEGAGRGLRQVEFNTISASFPHLAERLFRFHQLLYRHQPDLLSGLLPNDPLTPISTGIAEAVQVHGASNRVVLMIVQPAESNRMDQRGLEQRLLQQHGLSTVRATLADVAVQGKLRDGTLRLGGERVAVVYYRAGYTPSDFVHPDAEAGRCLLEASDAIQIPDLAMQLAGMKKVQQRLTSPETLARFVSESQATELLEVCAEMHSLDADSEETEFALAEATEHPERFVLKPQREGGGGNVYGAEIVKVLAEMRPEERSGWVLMERLHPVSHNAVLLVDHQAQSLRCVSELGRYGVLLAKGNEVLRLNEDAGYLVRTKGAEVDEGGVSAGYACLNSLVQEGKSQVSSSMLESRSSSSSTFPVPSATAVSGSSAWKTGKPT